MICAIAYFIAYIQFTGNKELKISFLEVCSGNFGELDVILSQHIWQYIAKIFSVKG